MNFKFWIYQKIKKINDFINPPKFTKFTKNMCWVCGGRDWEYVYFANFEDRSKSLIINPTSKIEEVAIEEDEQFEAGLEASILICTGGRDVITGKQAIDIAFRDFVKEESRGD